MHRIYGAVEYYKMNQRKGQILIDLLYEFRSVCIASPKNRNGKVHVELWPHHVRSHFTFIPVIQQCRAGGFRSVPYTIHTAK